jgi:hypothetical protein
MKAQAFLELVERVLTAQANYYAARKKGAGVITERDLLIKSKELEKQAWAVVKEGRLEPDEPTVTAKHLGDDAPVYVLDLFGNERPTDGKEINNETTNE